MHFKADSDTSCIPISYLLWASICLYLLNTVYWVIDQEKTAFLFPFFIVYSGLFHFFPLESKKKIVFIWEKHPILSHIIYFWYQTRKWLFHQYVVILCHFELTCFKEMPWYKEVKHTKNTSYIYQQEIKNGAKYSRLRK